MRHRVFTYITRDHELLIFDHVDQRYLAPQIPGGTVEPGEQPEQAALREATEETGLTELNVVSFFGDFVQDLTAMGRDETIHAWFYHLETHAATPQRWRHFESHSSENAEPIEFELYWVPLTAVPQLGGLDNTMISRLCSTAI